MKITYISSFELVGVSECHKKKQEVDFDLVVPVWNISCRFLINLNSIFRNFFKTVWCDF